MKRESKKAADQEKTPEQVKREKKAEYMRRYHAMKRKAIAKVKAGIAATSEPTPPESSEAESRDRIYGPVLKALEDERATIQERHRKELAEIDDGIAVLSRLAARQMRRDAKPAKGTRVFTLPAKSFPRKTNGSI